MSNPFKFSIKDVNINSSKILTIWNISKNNSIIIKIEEKDNNHIITYKIYNAKYSFDIDEKYPAEKKEYLSDNNDPIKTLLNKDNLTIEEKLMIKTYNISQYYKGDKTALEQLNKDKTKLTTLEYLTIKQVFNDNDSTYTIDNEISIFPDIMHNFATYGTSLFKKTMEGEKKIARKYTNGGTYSAYSDRLIKKHILFEGDHQYSNIVHNHFDKIENLEERLEEKLKIVSF